MNDWTMARWKEWLTNYPDEINMPYHDAEAVVADFRCHNTLLHLAVLGHWAAEMEATPSELVKLLLDRGADPNSQNDDGKTPLHLACELDSLSTGTVEFLLAGGADPMIVDNEGQMPVDRLFGQKEATRQVLKRLRDAMRKQD